MRVLGFNGISVLVSDLQSEKITPDIQTITAHQRVIEAARKMGTTLPVKFGVIFNNDKGIKDMLAKDLEKYKLKLSSFEGKDEFGIKVIETMKSSSSAKAKKPRSRATAGAGTEYLTALKREEASKMDSLRNKEKTKQEINDELAELAESSVNLRADIPQILLNRAYLVKQSNQASFVSRADSLRDRISRDGLLVHVSGPWAPYSFC